MSYLSTVDKYKVATYIRWSTDEQSDGTTLEVQLESCRLFIQAQGWQFREDLLFIDEGYSGGSMDRPGLTRLRQAVAEGQVNCVVVYKLDRLSRSVLDTVKLALEEWDGVCHIRSTREPIDTTSPTGAIFFYMLASYAEWERSIIRDRTMSGKIKRAQQGKNPGFTAPYGYRKGSEPGMFVVCEDEAMIVRRIFREYLAGKGYDSIAGLLNAEGIKTRKGCQWRGVAIMQILTNPAYKGTLRYGMTAVASKAQRKQVGKQRLTFDEPRYANVEGAVPVIVPPEEWEKAQGIREVRGAVAGARALSAEFLLTGIARCKCGSTVRGDGRASQGVGYRYYRCAGDHATNPTPCGCGVIPAEKLEQAVLERVRQELAPENRDLLLAGWQEETARKLRVLQAELERIGRALDEVERNRDRVTADYRRGDLPAKLYSANMESLDTDAEKLEAARRGFEAQLQRLQSTPDEFGELDEAARKLDAWDELEPEERKQVLRLAVARCTVYRKRNGSSKVNYNPIEVDLEIRRSTIYARAGRA